MLETDGRSAETDRLSVNVDMIYPLLIIAKYHQVRAGAPFCKHSVDIFFLSYPLEVLLIITESKRRLS